MDYIFVPQYYNNFTDTQIHILPPNIRYWQLCTSADFGITTENTSEEHWQEYLVRILLW